MIKIVLDSFYKKTLLYTYKRCCYNDHCCIRRSFLWLACTSLVSPSGRQLGGLSFPHRMDWAQKYPDTCTSRSKWIYLADVPKSSLWIGTELRFLQEQSHISANNKIIKRLTVLQHLWEMSLQKTPKNKSVRHTHRLKDEVCGNVCQIRLRDTETWEIHIHTRKEYIRKVCEQEKRKKILEATEVENGVSHLMQLNDKPLCLKSN